MLSWMLDAGYWMPDSSQSQICSSSSFESLLVTTTFTAPHFVIFSDKMFTLVLITSLLTNKLSLEIIDCSKVDFPPGAAQRSNTFKGSVRSQVCLITSSRNMLLASCT